VKNILHYTPETAVRKKSAPKQGNPTGIPRGRVTESDPALKSGLESRNSAQLISFCHFPHFYQLTHSKILQVDTVCRYTTFYQFRISVGVKYLGDVKQRINVHNHVTSPVVLLVVAD